MTEDIQHLIDRVRTEGVEKAEHEAGEILSKAKDQAARIVREAEEKAEDALKKADQDAQAFSERSTKTLEQAARDLLITVGQGVENILSDLVSDSVDEVMNPTFMKDMLTKMVDAYLEQGGSESRIDLLIAEKDQHTLVDYFKGRYQSELKKGIHLHVDSGILKGFKIAYDGASAYHDFSREAIAEALSNFLRPHLAEIVHRTAREQLEQQES